jgi:hypothetical protein
MSGAWHHVADGQAVVTQVESQRHEQVSIRPQAASTGQTRNQFRGQKPRAVDLTAVGGRAVPRSSCSFASRSARTRLVSTLRTSIS